MGYLSILPVVLVGVLATAGLTFLLEVVGEQWGFETPPPTHPVGDLLEDPSTAQIIGLFFLVSVFAPITEEIMFRGFLYNAIRIRWTWFWSGLLMGFIFAAIHPQGILGVPVLMALGLGFGMIREWRDTIVPSMTAHALHNGAAITAALLMMNL